MIKFFRKIKPSLTKTPFNILILLSIVLFYSCAVKPPFEKGTFKTSDLVELVKLDSTIHLDIRYATKNNLVGQPVYTEARAFLQRPAAETLVKINEKLKPLGYGLLIFDGYRPWSVTKLFWDITSKENKSLLPILKRVLDTIEVVPSI